MIQDSDLYWLAGIIEGEGFLTTNTRNGVHKKSNNGNGASSFITRIGIANTDMEMLKKVSTIFYELGAKFYYRLDCPDKRFPNSMYYVHISVEGYRSCKKILDAIADKMSDGSKKRQCLLMADYINYRLGIIQARADGEYKKAVTMPQKDIDFERKLKNLKREQIPPSTTQRKASLPLTW